MSSPDSKSSLSPRYAAKCAVAAEVLRTVGTVIIKNTSGSMIPSFWPGDALVVNRVDIGSISVGDSALYVRNGRLKLHRVIAKEVDSLITQGDAARYADEPVPASDVLGRVVVIHRGAAEIIPKSQLSAPRKLLIFVIRRSRRFWRLLFRLNAHRVRWNLEHRRQQGPA